jgi:PTS system sucrose-specific IIC component
MQIIFGTGVVNKVYAAFIQAAGISESSKSEAADIAAKKLNPFQRIARLLSNIFVPIIPAIVASGLLMGLLGMVKTYGWVDPSNALHHAGYVQLGGVYHSADPDWLYRRPRIRR